MKTEAEIRDDIFAYIKASPLAKAVSGKVLTNRRERDSTAEDIFIRVSAATYGQIQTAIVEVYVYFLDVTRRSDNVRDTARERELARITTDVLARHQEGTWRINMERHYVKEYQDIRQHALVNELYYQHSNN